MKANKLFILALSMPMVLAGITSCGAKHTMKHEDFVENQDLRLLYEVTYNDYSWDDVTNWMNSQENVNPHQGGFGCSSIHYGNYYGRSFDFCLTQMEEFLVRTKNENGHFASLGISIADCNMNKENVEKLNKGEGDEKDLLNEKMIPFCLVDGINENGVVCNTNVVPAKDLIKHEGEDTYHTHSTNPGKEDLFYQFMPRFILDNAKSAKHAVELLKNRNLTSLNKKGNPCDYFGISKMGYELHCMIADKDDTFVIEMVDDEMHVIKSGAEVMTNYYLSSMSPSGAGLERYSILFDDLEAWKKDPTKYNIDSMKETIHKVKYSPCYDPNWWSGTLAEDPKCAMWPTEFSGVKLKGVEAEDITFYNAADWCKEHWQDGVVNLKEALQTVTNQITSQLPNIKDRPEKLVDGLPWISTHAEVFDIENKSLHLATQEDEKDSANGEEKEYKFKEFKL